MQRITKADLERQVTRINRITNSPQEPMTIGEGNRTQFNSGCYSLDGAYGGWGLVRMTLAGGSGADEVIAGHHSMRDLYNRMNALITGLEMIHHDDGRPSTPWGAK